LLKPKNTYFKLNPLIPFWSDEDPLLTELELSEELKSTITPMMEIAPKIAFHGNDFELLIFFLALMCHLLSVS